MHIDIKIKEYTLDQQIEGYLNEKLSDVQRLIPESENVYARVQLGMKGKQQQSGAIYTMKVNVNVDGKTFRATAREASMEAAIDEIKDELMKEIRRYKDRQQSRARRGGRKMKELLWFRKNR